MIVFHGTATDANGTNNASFGAFDYNPTGERNQAIVRMLNIIQCAARLGQLADCTRIHIEITCRTCLLLRNIDRTQPRIVHFSKCYQIGTGIYHGDVHLYTQFV